MLSKLDPRIRAEQQLAKVIEQVARYEAEGIGTASQRAAAIESATRKYSEQIAVVERADRAQKEMAQRAVNAQLIVPDRAGDVAAYGKQLDDLRAKYNPLFAAGRQYKAGLDEINMAARVGAITEKERAEAVMSHKVAFVQQVNSIRGVNDALHENEAAGKKVTAQTGLARHEMMNFGRQVQDVGTMLAMGSFSPFMILATQGPQILDIFANTQGTLKGFAQQLKDSAASFLTPGRLLVLGLTAASAAAYGLYRMLRTEAPTAAQNVEEHARLVGVMRDAYSRATDAAGKFYAQSREQTILQAAANIDRLKRNLSDLVDEMTKASTTPMSIGMPEMGVGPDPSAMVAQERFKAFRAIIDDLHISIRKGAPDFDTFSKRISEMATHQPALRDAAIRLLKISKNATDMAQKVALAEASLRLLQGTATEADRELLNLSGTIKKVDMGRFREQHELALKSLTAFGPGAKAQIAYLEKRLELQERVNRQEMTAAQQEEQANAARVLALRGAAIAMSEAARARELDARQSTESAREEIAMVGRSAVEQERLRAITQARHQLDQEADRIRQPRDEAHLARLTREIDLQAKLKQQVAERKALDDAAFERAQIFRSDSEQQVASRLRGIYGNDYVNHMDGAIAAQLRLNEVLKATRDIGKEAFKGFVQDIIAGKSFLEALGNALNRIAQKLLDMAIDQMFAKAFGGMGGNIFGMFGGGGGMTTGMGAPTGNTLSFLYHGGGMAGVNGERRWVHSAYFENAPRMHNGGIAGDEVPAILKRGEPVFRNFEHARQVVGGSNARPIMQVSVQNHGPSEPEVRQSDDGMSIEVVIPALENAMAGRMSRGQGSLGRTARSIQKNQHRRG